MIKRFPLQCQWGIVYWICSTMTTALVSPIVPCYHVSCPMSQALIITLSRGGWVSYKILLTLIWHIATALLNVPFYSWIELDALNVSWVNGAEGRRVFKRIFMIFFATTSDLYYTICDLEDGLVWCCFWTLKFMFELWHR